MNASTQLHNDALIQVENLSFKRGERVIYDNIDVTIRRGKITAFMGPSGTGKTTLLRLIGGQLKPEQGKILLDAVQYFLIGSSVSRLNKNLQEINSNAFINSDRISTKPEDGRVILFSTTTADENTEKVLKLIYKEKKHPQT